MGLNLNLLLKPCDTLISDPFMRQSRMVLRISPWRICPFPRGHSGRLHSRLIAPTFATTSEELPALPAEPLVQERVDDHVDDRVQRDQEVAHRRKGQVPPRGIAALQGSRSRCYEVQVHNFDGHIRDGGNEGHDHDPRKGLMGDQIDI